MKRRQIFGPVIVSCVSACTTLGGLWSTPEVPPVESTDTLYVVDTVRVETESRVDSRLEERVAALQLQLLERDAQLADLQHQLDATQQEVVRNMAKLQSQASRAEAASGMAEAEIAMVSLRSVPGGGDVERAEALLAQSNEEFNKGNFGGALYLATQVRALARSRQALLSGVGGEGLRPGESLFALPIPLEATGRSNVREGPGLSFRVLFTVEGGAKVAGQSYTAQWVRIVDEQGREGWIYQSLVRSREGT
ncbi:MAG: SH3 domain-containing protein [Gemmatimonadota bacterium]|nr:SH3 domain-containing protein [Gemmatimonadota bacterium]